MPDIPTNPATPLGGTDTLTRSDAETASDTPWQVMLWNDDYNEMNYVSGALLDVLKIPREKALQLMLTAHTDGKVGVFSGDFPACEIVMAKLANYTLTTSVERTKS